MRLNRGLMVTGYLLCGCRDALRAPTSSYDNMNWSKRHENMNVYGDDAVPSPGWVVSGTRGRLLDVRTHGPQRKEDYSKVKVTLSCLFLNLLACFFHSCTSDANQVRHFTQSCRIEKNLRLFVYWCECDVILTDMAAPGQNKCHGLFFFSSGLNVIRLDVSLTTTTVHYHTYVIWD